MLFNSFDFAVFLPIVFGLYWYLNRFGVRKQNLLIVLASYFFYGFWDYRFLALIAISTIIDFSLGKVIHRTENRSNRKRLLATSIIVNLGFLGFFKYCNFFIESFVDAFAIFGQPLEVSTLNIVLPVGISFYTFQTMSYTIDVYRKKLNPSTDLISFSAFVAFFPQLVAGPIERATNLLPQFSMKRKFDYDLAVNGTRQILWGLFKKVVIADIAAGYANEIFNNSEQYPGSVLLVGALMFTIQIYGDFSGYSDIAIGTARLFGFDLMQNFRYPYFSRDIAEFWRRWHISLSTWFRDYLYIPLGGSKGGPFNKIRNVFIIFLVSGFWHGDNWTFLFWGGLNALYFLPLLLSKKNRNHTNEIAEGKRLPSVSDGLRMVVTFGLTVFAWIFFRAENINHAFEIIGEIASSSLFTSPEILPKKFLLLVLLFFMIEWVGRTDRFAIEQLFLKRTVWLRYSFYFVLVGFIFWNINQEQTFIYFQF